MKFTNGNDYRRLFIRKFYSFVGKTLLSAPLLKMIFTHSFYTQQIPPQRKAIASSFFHKKLGSKIRTVSPNNRIDFIIHPEIFKLLKIEQWSKHFPIQLPLQINRSRFTVIKRYEENVIFNILSFCNMDKHRLLPKPEPQNIKHSTPKVEEFGSRISRIHTNQSKNNPLPFEFFRIPEIN